MNPIYLEVLGALVRAAMLILSGWLVERHVLTADLADRLTTDVVTHVVILAPAAAAIAWSIIAKWLKQRKLALAEKFGPLAAIVLAIGLVAGASAGCASARPPAGTYTQPVQHAWDATEALHALTALAQTAKNLNAQSGQLHLSDRNTAYVRDNSLLVGAFLNAYGEGATTLGAVGVAIDRLQLPPGVGLAVRNALSRAIVDHGAGASVLVLVRESYGAFTSGLAIDASQHPKLVAVLQAVAIALENMPEGQ